MGGSKKDKALLKKKRNLTKTRSSCSYRTTVFSNIQLWLHSMSKIMFSPIHIWCSCHPSRGWEENLTFKSALILRLLSAQSRTIIWDLYLTKCAKVITAIYAYILNRKVGVKQSTARTITRTPIHTLSCILEYTMVQFPWMGSLTELSEHSDYSAKRVKDLHILWVFSWHQICQDINAAIQNST